MNTKWIIGSLLIPIIGILFTIYNNKPNQSIQQIGDTQINNQNTTNNSNNTYESAPINGKNNVIQASPNAQINITNNIIPKTKEKNHIDISPRDIIDDLKKLTPYEQNLQKEKYINIPIKWKLTFENLHGSNNETTIMSLYEHSYPWVTFDISLEEFPIFKIAEKESSFTVIGQIKRVDGNLINITAEKIEASEK